MWFDNVQAEFIASRETCSLSDLTSFAKMEVRSSGLEVVNFLQYLCSGNIDIKVGENYSFGRIIWRIRMYDGFLA